MDLSLYFAPIQEELIELSLSKANLGQSLHLYEARIPDLQGIEIAILGVEENRGTTSQSIGYRDAANVVRYKLYGLQKGTPTYRIADLGNLRNGPTRQDTLERLQQVLHYLMEQGILPIVVGGSHDLTLGQYLAYEDFERMVNVLIIDPRLDIGESEAASESFLGQLIKHNPNYLHQLLHLGHQSYLVEEDKQELLQAMYFEAIRLGVVREQLQEMEPVVRSGDMLSFDISAINQSYAPGATQNYPFGLTGEEACQLCWYAGMNERMTSIGFFEYDADKDDENGTTAFVLATMIWYVIEGFYQRVGEKDFQSEKFLIYEVDMDEEPSSIRFFKSRRTEKWWMEVPNPEGAQSVFIRNKMVPCSYQDYELALKGEIPSRWMSAFTRRE
ncbi:MAG: formimidoylglutamase [Bacteroidota bacterium]